MQRNSWFTFMLGAPLVSAMLVTGCANCNPETTGGGTGVTEAHAKLIDMQGKEVGEVEIDRRAGGVELQVEVHDMPPGLHGIHIHQVGLCEGDFTSAGEHLNPTGAQHGLENPKGPHMGDLPNLLVAEDGRGQATYMIAGATLDPQGAESLLADDGAALVIHAAADDNVSDPAGNSGARIACGVIEPD